MSDCQNFPGLGTRQTDTQTDTQPIPRIWLSDPREFPGYTNTHSKPSREENEVVRKFHAQAKGIEPLRPDIWYNNTWILAVSTGSGCSTWCKPLREILFQTIRRKMQYLCCKESNQPTKTRRLFHPNQQAQNHCEKSKLKSRTGPPTRTPNFTPFYCSLVLGNLW